MIHKRNSSNKISATAPTSCDSNYTIGEIKKHYFHVTSCNSMSTPSLTYPCLPRQPKTLTATSNLHCRTRYRPKLYHSYYTSSSAAWNPAPFTPPTTSPVNLENAEYMQHQHPHSTLASSRPLILLLPYTTFPPSQAFAHLGPFSI